MSLRILPFTDRGLTVENPIISVVKQQAAELLAKDGFLNPIFMLFKSGLKPIFLSPAFADEQSKQDAADQIRSLAVKIQPDFIVFVTEVWAAPAPEDTGDYVPASQRPDRKEYVQVALMYPSRVDFHLAEISRLANGSATLGPWQRWDGSATGRFANLLQPDLPN